MLSLLSIELAESIVDLTQMLALIAMERPGSFSAEDLRQEKVRQALHNEVALG